MLRDGNAAGEWHGGWRIFTDWNRNETFDGNANATDCSVEGQDCYLRIYDSLGNNLILTGDAKYQDWIAFSPSGEVLSSGGGLPMGRFTLCTPNTNGREVVLNNAGRMRVEEGNAAC